ncbi:MAG: hypothetical protein NZ531_05215 [Aquificaceae bacterium]|nr:hypothetical protein [Aquificaceae bacterium]
MRGILLLVFLLTACGIKANPEVLKPPEVEIKRVGSKVYIRSLSGEVSVKGFQREGPYWAKEYKEAFCFSVQRLGGKSQKFCVANAIDGMPSIKISEKEEEVKLEPIGFPAYRLYPLKDGLLILEEGKSLMGSFYIKKEYAERCYAITGVKGNAESYPLNFCVKPKPPPPVPEVEGLEIREGKDKIYLVWFYPRNYREFVVYEQEREIGRTTGFSLEAPMPKAKTTFTVKVISPEGFQSRGVSLVYNP